jgi:hypothetical protein
MSLSSSPHAVGVSSAERSRFREKSADIYQLATPIRDAPKSAQRCVEFILSKLSSDPIPNSPDPRLSTN